MADKAGAVSYTHLDVYKRQLVGMLNLNGCLHKAGVAFSTLWSKDFQDDFFRRGLRQWLKEQTIEQDSSHVRELDLSALPQAEKQLGASLAHDLKTRKAILGVFDEGCMGMYNAIIEDYLLNPTGVYKERLSQSALVSAMAGVTDKEAQAVRSWLDGRGFTFVTGAREETDLTDRQILEQCKMYIAAMRMADEFGCDAIGIQYQQGLKDMAPASDLVEGLLNNVDPVSYTHLDVYKRQMQSRPCWSHIQYTTDFVTTTSNRNHLSRGTR